MPADKKFTRSTLKNSEEKNAQETMSSSYQKPLLIPANTDLPKPADMFLSEDFLERFVEMVSQRINNNFQILIANLESKHQVVAEKVAVLESENTRLKDVLDRQEQ